MESGVTKGCIVEGITSGVLKKIKTDNDVYMCSINSGWKVLDVQMSDKQIKVHNNKLRNELLIS